MKSLYPYLRKTKKGQLGNLPQMIMLLVVAVIALVIGIVVVQEIRDVEMISNTGAVGCNDTGKEACGQAYDSANASLIGLGDFSDFVPIIVIALAASIVIGLILVGFAFSGRRSR